MKITKILWMAIPVVFLLAAAAAIWGPGSKSNPEVRLREIVVKANPEDPDDVKRAREKIAIIYGKLEDGADFGDLAVRESEALNAGQRGDMGWKGTGVLPARLEDAAFALEAGQHSEIIRDRVGDLVVYRILYAEKRRNF